MNSELKKKITTSLPRLFSVLIIAIYVLLAIHYAQIIEPVMDEGTYLLKGMWYWNDTYQPFEEYGPITNKPPLAFYSLGISQILFEPGLESGRYFAIFLSVLLLIGQWMTVKRLAGEWWATFSIALYIISPAWIIYYSRAMTQVVTSLLIVWSLYFFLGENRNKSQLIIGAILSACMVMVRQNLLPLFFFSLVYIVWENGFRKSWLPVLIGISTFIAFNLFYWSEIYTAIWYPYLPEFLNNIILNIFNLEYIPEAMGTSYLNREYIPIYEIQVLFDGVRYFFVPILATILSFIVLFPRKMFTEKVHRKTAFLACSFLFLSALHFGFVSYDNTILYSFPAYLAFYLPIGICLIPLFTKDILTLNNKTRHWVLSITILLLTTGIGLSLYRQIAPFFMNINLPSLSLRTFSGPYELWDVLLNQYNISIRTQEFLIPAVVGLFTGVLILLLSKLFHAIIRRKNEAISYGSILILFVFCLAILLSPTFILAAQSSIATCPNTNILTRYEEIGAAMQGYFPKDSLIYWEGFTPIALLYLPDVEVFPAQLNMYFWYQNGGDADYLEKRGFWNEELALEWIDEADFLVFNQQAYLERFTTLSAQIQSQFVEIPNDITLDPCNEDSVVIILERVQPE